MRFRLKATTTSTTEDHRVVLPIPDGFGGVRIDRMVLYQTPQFTGFTLFSAAFLFDARRSTSGGVVSDGFVAAVAGVPVIGFLEGANQRTQTGLNYEVSPDVEIDTNEFIAQLFTTKATGLICALDIFYTPIKISELEKTIMAMM